MADQAADARRAAQARPRTKSRVFRTARAVHKIAGLAGCVWLFVLGATGVVLDHEEWRWPQQAEWPREWTSPTVGRLVRGTIMRFVAVDPADPARWIGASQRGLWRTEDRGETWNDIPFEGESGHPQVFTVLQPRDGGFHLGKKVGDPIRVAAEIMLDVARC